MIPSQAKRLLNGLQKGLLAGYFSWLGDVLRGVSNTTLGDLGITSSAGELNALHLAGVTNADAIKLHAVGASALDMNSLTGVAAYFDDLVRTRVAVNQAQVQMTLRCANGAAVAPGAAWVCWLYFTVMPTTIVFNAGMGAMPQHFAVGEPGMVAVFANSASQLDFTLTDATHTDTSHFMWIVMTTGKAAPIGYALFG